ncbi:hypothetical protein AY599_02565 [Leptolyngbya valderiana BDU 20041]|nr:hypothetical protein AY599_02565 [Leptolyngbya valderiana BDU 20041]
MAGAEPRDGRCMAAGHLEPALADLRRIAAAAMVGERGNHTLQPTALVNEFYLKLAASKGYDELRFPSKDHLLAYASEAIANILIDHARRKNALKRGGGMMPAPLDGRDIPGDREEAIAAQRATLVAELLAKLEIEHPLSARVARMRYFGHMNDVAIASVLGVSPRSVSNYWRAARAWLATELADAGSR